MSAADPAAEAPAPPQAADDGVNRAAGRNAVWTMGGFVAMQAIRFISNLVLARLLFPDVFGVMTLVNTFLQGIQMFTDVGIGPSLVQNKRGEERDFLNTAWTIMVVRGFGLWLIALAAAWPLHLVYSDYDPPLYLVLPAVAAVAAINGFESTSIYTLQRRLLRARRVMLEVGTYLVTTLLTIAGCWLLRDHFRNDPGNPDFLRGAVWILVASNLFSTVVQMVISHFLIPGYRNWFHWDREAFKELFHFGKWVFVSTLFTFLAMQSDKLIVGVDQTALGVYSIAINLAMIPGHLLNTVGWQLVFPLYSRLHQSGQEIRSTFSRLHPLASGFAAFLVAGLIGAGPSLVAFLYDVRYHEAGWMLQILALGVWFQALEVLECSILWTQGETRAPTMSNIAKVAALVVFVPVGQSLGGFAGMLFAFVAADFVRYACTLRAVRAQGLAIIRYDLSLTTLVIVSGGLACYVSRLLWPQPPFELTHLGALMVAPDGGVPGALPWGHLIHSTKKPWLFHLERALTESAIVVLFWAVPAIYCWKKGLFSVTRGRPDGG